MQLRTALLLTGALALVAGQSHKSPDGKIDCGEWIYSDECPKDRPCYTLHDIDPATGLSHRCTTPPVIDFQPTCKLPQPLWTAVDTSPGESMSYGMAADKVAGGLWIAGTFKDRMKLTKGGSGGSGGTEISTSHTTDDDMYVMGLDADGNYLKHWVFSGDGTQTLIDTAFNAGKLAIVGYHKAENTATPSKTSFPLIGGTSKEFNNAKVEYSDAFVAVIDTTKEQTETSVVEWAASVENLHDSKLYATDIDAAGNVVAVGHTCTEDAAGHPDNWVNCGQWTFTTQCPLEKPCYTGNDVDPTTGQSHACAARPANPPKPDKCDAIIQLYPSADVTVPKVARIPSLADDEGNSLWGVKLDGTGAATAVYVTGRIRGENIAFGGQCGAISSILPHQDSVVVAKFDSNMACVYAKVFGVADDGDGHWHGHHSNSKNGDSGWDLVVKGDFIYVVGSSSGEGDRQGMWQGRNSGFLLKMKKADGTPVWGSDIPNSRGLDVNAEGKFVYIMGLYSGSAVFSVGGSPHLTMYSKGGIDMFVGKIDAATGKGAWAMDAGGTGVEYPWMLEIDKNDDIFISGLTQSPELHYGQDTGKASSIAGVSRMFLTKLDKTETMPSCLSACGEVKEGFCFIHNKCYQHKEASPYEGVSCLKCNSDEDKQMWVHDADEGCYIDDRCIPKGDFKTTKSGSQSVCELCNPEKDPEDWDVLDGFAVVGFDNCENEKEVKCGIVGVRSGWCSGRHPCLDLEDGVCKTAPSCVEDGFTYDDKACPDVKPCYKDGKCGNAFPTFPDCGDFTFEPLGCYDRYKDSWMKQPKPCYDSREGEHQCRAPAPALDFNPIKLPEGRHFVQLNISLAIRHDDFNNVRQQLVKQACSWVSKLPVVRVFITEVAPIGKEEIMVIVRVETDDQKAADKLAQSFDGLELEKALQWNGILNKLEVLEKPAPSGKKQDHGGHHGLSTLAIVLISVGSVLGACALVGLVVFLRQREEGISLNLPGFGSGFSDLKDKLMGSQA